MDAKYTPVELEKEYTAALNAAPTTSRKMRCQGCGKKRLCKAHGSGLVSSPIMWVCKNCWLYATELK